MRGGSRRRANRRHAKSLGNRGHRVGGKHATTGAGTWAGLFLQLVQVFLAHRAARHCTDRLEDVLNVDVLATELAGHDRAAVEKAARQIEARRAHQHAGKALVATSNRDGAVEALGVHDQLVGVRDVLARDERGTHALVAHGDAVGDRDRIEDQRDSASSIRTGLRVHSQLVEMVVTRRDLVPRRRDSNLRLRKVLILQTNRAQHGAGGGATESVGDIKTAAAAMVVAHGQDDTRKRAGQIP